MISYRRKINITKRSPVSSRSLGKLDAAMCGTGTIEQLGVSLCIHDFAFLAGSMGAVVGEKIARSAERAAEQQIPLITVNTSGGARMHEGILSLMQMAKVSVALARLGEAGQPHISLLVDPCMGGVTASHASAADVIIAEPGAVIGFAGRRVIEQTIRQKLPPDFQTAEFQLEHGMVDMVVPRSDLRYRDRSTAPVCTRNAKTIIRAISWRSND